MITNTLPKEWRDLQKEVGKILEQCGFSVEIEKKVTTARGGAELDVYAEEVVKGRKYTIICECKYWKFKVPQSVIHSFRTILEDTGINKGYLISIEGFQSGSFKAAGFTNLELLKWDEFQNEFCNSWLENYLIPTITKELEEFFDNTEPLLNDWMVKLPKDELKEVESLRAKYFPTSMLLGISFTTYGQIVKNQGGNISVPSLPLAKNKKLKQELLDSVPDKIKYATGYKEFLEECLKFGKEGISEFRKIRKRNGV